MAQTNAETSAAYLIKTQTTPGSRMTISDAENIVKKLKEHNYFNEDQAIEDNNNKLGEVDMVNHPPHYTSHPVFSGECIDWIWDLPKAQSDICKYAWRINDKDTPQTNAGKINFYAEFLRTQANLSNFKHYPDTTWRLSILTRQLQQWFENLVDEEDATPYKYQFDDPKLETIRLTSLIIVETLDITTQPCAIKDKAAYVVGLTKHLIAHLDDTANTK